MSVKAYWWKGAPNFGDALAPYLLKQFAGVKVEWASISRAKIASVGSILEHIPLGWGGYILGSGRLFPSKKLKFSNARIISLRGPLSARGITGGKKYPLGDPGLLADELVGPQHKIYDLGIVPHWRDTELVPRFEKMKLKGEIKIIRPDGNPLTIIKQIGQCKRIVTSSLHGLIVADSFGGIPRRLEVSPALLKEGGDFKFRDYHASIKMPFVTGQMCEPNRWSVEDVKFAVFDAFKVLERELKS